MPMIMTTGARCEKAKVLKRTEQAAMRVTIVSRLNGIGE